MKYIYLFLVSALLSFYLGSCSEENVYTKREGSINISLSANNSLEGKISRASDVNSPDVGDFSVTITKKDDGSVIGKWDKFSQFESVKVQVGQYDVSASYGDKDTEGFDALSYLGNKTVDVIEGEMAKASIECTINKARVSLAYTDNFKKYFKTYQAYIKSSKGKQVDYSNDETRGAYFLPGDLGLYLKVTREGVTSSVILNPKNFTVEEQHDYQLTLDVDASSAALDIIFNDSPSNSENVSMDISDDKLNAPLPVITPTGFTTETPIEILEGTTVSGELQAFVNAQSGLKSCVLTTTSVALKEQGWPESIDLISGDTETLKKMKSLGLTTMGLENNVDKIAIVDFKNILPHLYCTGDHAEETHSFELIVTDQFGRTCEQPLVLNVVTRTNGFAVTYPENVPYNGNQLTLTLTVEGDAINDLQFYYKNFGAEYLFDSSSVNIQETSTLNQYEVTLTYPFTFDKYVDTGLWIRVVCGRRSIEKVIEVGSPILTLTLKNGDADVWAKHADFQIVTSSRSRAISGSSVELQYKESENVWKKWENVVADATDMVSVRGLNSNTSYTFRAVYRQNIYSNELTIKTEEELNVPNAGFENWFSNKITEDGTDLSGNDKVYWNKWYPWDENDSQTKGWNTVNQTTTQYGAKPSTFWGLPTSPYVGCCYTTTSGTIRTNEKNSGSYAALIRTVGWGKGNTAAGSIGKCENVTPGELYLGTYDVGSHQPQYGYTFTSRPIALQFMYKYVPKNLADYFVVIVEVKNINGDVIASKTITKSGTVSNYTLETLNLGDYVLIGKAAKLSIIFKSSGNENCLSANQDNLNYPPATNLSDGEYVGSQLYIDDIELIYE